MVAKRVVAALFVSNLIAAAAFAQSASTLAPDEFGRVSGGEINVITKSPSRLSGSFSLSASHSQSPLALGTAKGLDASIGGTLVQDRVWFFASAQHTDGLSSRFANALPQSALPSSMPSRNVSANANATIGDRQTLSAMFSNAKDSALTTSGTVATLPSTFMSLHYTGVISPNAFFSASVSRRSSSGSELMLQPR